MKIDYTKLAAAPSSSNLGSLMTFLPSGSLPHLFPYP